MSITSSASLAAGARVYVAGHRGLAGSAIVRRLAGESCAAIVTRTHAELDLSDQEQVSVSLLRNDPDYVFLAAAKVGGILANNTRPADFIRENLAIETNVIAAARDFGVKRLLFLGSSCIYPRDCPQPIREEYMLTGPAGADQPSLRGGQDCGHRIVLGLQPPIWDAISCGDAYQSLWARTTTTTLPTRTCCPLC